MTRRQQIYYLFLNLLSAVLLMSETTIGLKSVVLVIVSLLLAIRPITLLPVLFVSSWSITFVALPGLAAFFYYLVLFLVSVLLSNRRSRTFTSPPRHQVIFAAWFAIWILATGFLSVSGEWYGPLKLALYIVPLVLFSRLRFKNMDFLKKSLVVIAAFFSVYFLLIAWLAPAEFVPEQETTDMVLESFPSFRSDMNPNTASQIVLLVFVILYCGAFRTKKYWLIGFALLNISSFMYLGSRTAFFAVCIIAVVYLVLVLKMSFIKKSLILLLVATIFFGSFSMRNRFERAERLSVSSVQEDEGSGRFVMWGWLFTDAIPNNLIYGIGFGLENYEYYNFTTDADNMYIDVLCQTGIVGLLLFMTFYIRTIVLLWKKRKLNWDWDFLIAIFLAYLVEGWGESVFDTPMFWFCGMIAVLAINENNCIQEKKALVGS